MGAVTFLAVIRVGDVIKHQWACSEKCASRLDAPAREVTPPTQTKRCAGCGQSLGGGPRRS